MYNPLLLCRRMFRALFDRLAITAGLYPTFCTRLPDALLNRRALQEYILYAGQHAAGGLRDKPPK